MAISNDTDLAMSIRMVDMRQKKSVLFVSLDRWEIAFQQEVHELFWVSKVLYWSISGSSMASARSPFVHHYVACDRARNSAMFRFDGAPTFSDLRK